MSQERKGNERCNFNDCSVYSVHLDVLLSADLRLSVLRKEIMKEIINELTGEIEQVSEENTSLAKVEVEQLPMMVDWMYARDEYLAAKEKFEMVDKPFKEKLTEIFERYSIKSLKSKYMDFTLKNGFNRETWDNKALEKFILTHGGDPEDFKKRTWVKGSMMIKYKE